MRTAIAITLLAVMFVSAGTAQQDPQRRPNRPRPLPPQRRNRRERRSSPRPPRIL